ncbi:Hypothetical predicted protein [Pelobates cultripes]|uniref:Uncharacterized protein n=1 Tax=Pelobates cultripes TaxID=61616 RepID=A0AAD1R8F3_PELCU|nr:Hypothetical predicted protein [Pelobates cultripes]
MADLTYQINITALTLLSRKWRNTEPPTIQECIHLVNHNKISECAARLAVDQQSKVWRIAWEKWTEVMETNTPTTKDPNPTEVPTAALT